MNKRITKIGETLWACLAEILVTLAVLMWLYVKTQHHGHIDSEYFQSLQIAAYLIFMMFGIAIMWNVTLIRYKIKKIKDRD